MCKDNIKKTITDIADVFESVKNTSNILSKEESSDTSLAFLLRIRNSKDKLSNFWQFKRDYENKTDELYFKKHDDLFYEFHNSINELIQYCNSNSIPSKYKKNIKEISKLQEKYNSSKTNTFTSPLSLTKEESELINMNFELHIELISKALHKINIY